MKLGLNKTDKNVPILNLRWSKGRPPKSPDVVDNFVGWTIGLDGNDNFGDCGPTSVDNHRRLTTKLLTGTEVQATQDQVFDLYKRSGNPDFDPKTDSGDNGVEMSVMLDAVAKGGLAGIKILGYAKLTDLSDASIHAAIDLFGGVLFGVTLELAQQSQKTHWDFHRSRVWGGHAVVAAAYTPTSIDVGSWATRIGTTRRFRQHQLDEVWIPLWPEIVTGKLFDSAVDLDTLKADYKALTGQEFPSA